MGWDDALDVWGVHGIGGCLGTILLGVFASKAINAGGADGLIYGGSKFFLYQTLAVVGTCIYVYIFTYGMLALINMVTPVKVDESAEAAGLDASIHGEQAYDAGVV
jgi:Amt family ammonium transporter